MKLGLREKRNNIIYIYRERERERERERVSLCVCHALNLAYIYNRVCSMFTKISLLIC